MPRKVILIDDDQSICDSVSLILKEDGYEVNAYKNAPDALEKMESYKPDVILLDFLLSGTDGLAVTKRIRTTETLKNIPIVLFSAHPTARKLFEQHTVQGFIEKPFDIVDLYDCLNKAMNGSNGNGFI